MIALITGASSGIGSDIARELAQRGCDLILTARREDRLKELSRELSEGFKINCEIISTDLSSPDNCVKLHDMVKERNIDILINNAGFGVFGDFQSIELKRELDLISVNIESLHILTKLFLKDFMKRDNKCYIMNVASIAGFMAGPQMAAYYASKSYVLNLSMAIYEELRHNKNKVSISCLCPGPVKTEFSQVANVKFGINSMSSEKVAAIGVKNMFKGKLIIIPGFMNKVSVFMTRLVPKKFVLKIVYSLQRFKGN